MENTFKLRILKLLQSSFNSCRTKPISDVSDQPLFSPENHHHRHLIDLFSPKQNHPISHPRITAGNPHFPPITVAGKTHSVSVSLSVSRPVSHQKKPKSSKTTKKNKPHHRKTTKLQNFSSITDNYYYNCCTSDEDNEIDTLFSSRSFSSDSSVSFRKIRGSRRKCKNRGGGCKDWKATDVIPITGIGRFVRDSVAVVKKSSDPYEDFRVSMLEMIVERRILGFQGFENLLKCFLMLNSEEHHEVICDVYTEILETLFCSS